MGDSSEEELRLYVKILKGKTLPIDSNVECLISTGVNLTKGRSYKIISVCSDKVQVKNDNYSNLWYSKHRFNIKH